MANDGLVVLNYNDWQRTVSLVKLVISFGRFSRIVIVNNKGDSSDVAGLSNFAETERFPGLQILFLETNYGYCSGSNAGLRFLLQERKCQHIYLVNSDIFFEEKSILECDAFLRDHPDFGAVAPLMKTLNGNVDNNWGLFPTYSDGVHSLFFFGEKRFSKKQYQDSARLIQLPFFEVPWIRSSFIAFDVEALGKTSLFDERFFLYCGEYTLFSSLHEQGYRSAIISSSSYVHDHHENHRLKSLHNRKKSSIRSMYDYLRFYLNIKWPKKIWFRIASFFALLEYDCLYLRLNFKKKH